MALVAVNKVRKVRPAIGKGAKAYVLNSSMVDDATIVDVVAETNLDGSAIVLDSTEEVQRAILRGGFYFLTDDTGKTALGF